MKMKWQSFLCVDQCYNWCKIIKTSTCQNDSTWRTRNNCDAISSAWWEDTDAICYSDRKTSWWNYMCMYWERVDDRRTRAQMADRSLGQKTRWSSKEDMVVKLLRDWGFCSSLLLRWVAGLLIPDILKEHTAFIFGGQGAFGLLDPGLLDPWRWRQHVSSKLQESITLLLIVTTQHHNPHHQDWKPQILH